MQILEDHSVDVGAGVTIWQDGSLHAHNRSSRPLTLTLKNNGTCDYLDLAPDEIRIVERHKSGIIVGDHEILKTKIYHFGLDHVSVSLHPIGFMDPGIVTLHLKPLSKSRQHLYVANMTDHHVVLVTDLINGKSLDFVTDPRKIMKFRVSNLPMRIGSDEIGKLSLYRYHNQRIELYGQDADHELGAWQDALTACFINRDARDRSSLSWIDLLAKAGRSREDETSDH